jgi:hypothetical protein
MDEKRIIAALKNSAEELALEIARLPAEGTLWRPGEGEWSQHEILTHIWIADHFVFLPRLRRMATEDNPFLPVVDEVALQKSEWNPDKPREELLKEFMADRGAEIDLLKAHNWDRPGTHGSLGPITLGWVGQYALAHTWEHASQAMRARLYYTLRGPGKAG